MDEGAGDVFVERRVIGCAEVYACEGLTIPEEIVEVKISVGERHAPFGKVDLAIELFHLLQHAGFDGAQAVVRLLFGGFLGPAAPRATVGCAPLFAWGGELAQPVGGEGYGRGTLFWGESPERREQTLAFGQRGDCESRFGGVKERLLDCERRGVHIGPDAGELFPFLRRGFLRLGGEGEAEDGLLALKAALKHGVTTWHEVQRWADAVNAALKGSGCDMSELVQSGAGLFGEKLNVTRLNHCHRLSICAGGCELNPKRCACMVGENELERRMSETPVNEMSFEAAMAELEKVVGQLERGDVPLEDSIKLYERGAVLKKHCEGKLKDAEEKVAAITLDGEGNPTGTQPLDVD